MKRPVAVWQQCLICETHRLSIFTEIDPSAFKKGASSASSTGTDVTQAQYLDDAYACLANRLAKRPLFIAHCSGCTRLLTSQDERDLALRNCAQHPRADVPFSHAAWLCAVRDACSCTSILSPARFAEADWDNRVGPTLYLFVGDREREAGRSRGGGKAGWRLVHGVGPTSPPFSHWAPHSLTLHSPSLAGLGVSHSLRLHATMHPKEAPTERPAPRPAAAQHLEALCTLVVGAADDALGKAATKLGTLVPWWPALQQDGEGVVATWSDLLGTDD